MPTEISPGLVVETVGDILDQQDKARAGLAKMREPFAANHISKLPKPTKAQTDAVKANFRSGVRCQECGAWHHPDVVHLDYVGHAALTDRLLDADPLWNWEPVAWVDGLPAFDKSGGLWIRLTVCGQTRLGYGHAAGKPNADPGAREKEVIGDALRNAGMRFGAALDLWHKGDLHADEDAEKPTEAQTVKAISPAQELELQDIAREAGTDMAAFLKWIEAPSLATIPAQDYGKARDALVKDLKRSQAARLARHDLDGEAPYLG